MVTIGNDSLQFPFELNEFKALLEKADKTQSKQNDIEWGFDTSSFESRDEWFTFCHRHNLDTNGVLTDTGWMFANEHVRVFTSYHPSTGEHYHRHDFHDWEGLAGYIGISGCYDRVMAIVKDLRKVADPKDESRLKRSFI